jgi:hypothetical protein
MEIQFSEPLDPIAANDPKNYATKVWSLKRTADYGSKHYNEHPLAILKATLSPDGKSVSLIIPDLQPTWGMEIKFNLQGADGTTFTRVLHNTIHQLSTATADR